MKLSSLKMTKKEATEEFGVPQAAGTKGSAASLPLYPYGTKIRLETEALAKLGCDPADYKVGDVLEVTARVEVVSTDIREMQSGERKELELQITDMSINEDKASKKAKREGKHLNDISGPTSAPVDQD